MSGTGFYGSNDPTDSVKALKEVVVLRTGFNPTRSTSPCYKPTHAYNIQWLVLWVETSGLAVQTRLNRSKCRLEDWLMPAQGTAYKLVSTLAHLVNLRLFAQLRC